MEQERSSENGNNGSTGSPQGGYLLPASIAFAAIVLGGAWVYTTGVKTPTASPIANEGAALVAGTAGHDGGGTIAAQSVELPIAWGDLGARMVETGVIDKEQFEVIYAARVGLGGEDKK